MHRLAMTWVVLTLGAFIAAVPRTADHQPLTTLERSIGDGDGDRRLEDGPGDGRVTREDLGELTALPSAGSPALMLAALVPLGGAALAAPAAGVRLLTFAQLSDMHVVDEESPLRMEFLDPVLGRSYRPQDGLTPHVLERMVAAVRDAVSPVSGRRAELAITTGDNTDTGQRNEVRWFIDILDGGRSRPTPESPARVVCDRTVSAIKVSAAQAASTSRMPRDLASTARGMPRRSRRTRLP